MPKWLKVILWILGSILLLICIAWGILYYYVYYNKKPLLEKISKEASAQINGEVIIEDLDLAFWRDFPEVSLQLLNVRVSDSLYSIHHRALFQAEELYVKMNFPSIFSSISEVEKVNIVNASLHMFTDSSGYSNKYLIDFKETEQEITEKKKREIYIFFANLDNFKLLIEDVPADKKFDVQIHSLHAALINTDTSITISAPIIAQIGQLGFNLEKGPFLVNKKLEAKFEILFHKPRQTLRLPLQTIQVENEALQLGLLFDFSEKPGKYEVEIADDSILLEKGLALLNRHIVSKLDKFTLDKPVGVKAFLSGTFVKKGKPYVHVDFYTKNNLLDSDFGKIDSVSFKGFYDNNYEDGLGYIDSNSFIKIDTITGKYNGNLPFTGDSIIVHNFKKTHLCANIYSKFNVTALNDLVGNALTFSKGNAEMKLHFDGYINSKIRSKRNLIGYIKVNKGQMLYKPRNLSFNEIDFDLQFTGQDLILKKIDLSRGRTVLHVDGTAKNFMNAYFDNPDKIHIEANVQSNLLDINDFKALLATKGGKAPVSERAKKRKMQELNDRIDNMLTQGSMHLHMNVAKIEMDNFHASNMVADVTLLSNKIQLNKVKVSHAGGYLDIAGYVNQNAKNNPFALNGIIQNVNLNEFLYAFDNFGMQAVTNENIRGKFTSDIDLVGNFTDEGTLLKKSIKGNINFVLSEAAFIKFYPFTEIKKYVFKSRNLDSITFFDIKNNLLIEDGKVMIFPMEIRNNAMNVFVKGIYAFEEGTDLSIEIPLANPKKDNKRVLEGRESKRKGLKVYLRASDGEDGKVKVTWDPFKKGQDAVDAKLHLTDAGELKEEEEEDDHKTFFLDKYKDMLMQQVNSEEKKEKLSGEKRAIFTNEPSGTAAK